MGIVNLNDDSFSGDGSLDPEEALETAARHAREGADIVDMGAESARTNREAIPVEEEIGRLLPILECFGKRMEREEPAHGEQLWPPLLSVNTWRPAVIEAVHAAGVADLVDDMGGLESDENARLCAAAGAALLVMHTKAPPKVARTGQRYGDVWEDLLGFFEERIARAENAGMPSDRIILDPGIDFAKQRDDNLAIYRDLERLVALGRPVLLPVSRKTVIGEVLGLPRPADRDAGTVACLVRGFSAGAHVFRVHDSGAASRALRCLEAIRGSGTG